MKFTAVVTMAILLSFICHAQSHKLNFVKIELEDFNTETIYDINCEAFNTTFKETKKIKIFYNAQDLLKFESLLKSFQSHPKNNSIDVRGSIIYNYGKTSTKYCFGKFAIFYNGGKLFFNKKLLIYIIEKVNGDHEKYLDTLRNQ